MRGVTSTLRVDVGALCFNLPPFVRGQIPIEDCRCSGKDGVKGKGNSWRLVHRGTPPEDRGVQPVSSQPIYLSSCVATHFCRPQPLNYLRQSVKSMIAYCRRFPQTLVRPGWEIQLCLSTGSATCSGVGFYRIL